MKSAFPGIPWAWAAGLPAPHPSPPPLPKKTPSTGEALCLGFILHPNKTKSPNVRFFWETRLAARPEPSDRERCVGIRLQELQEVGAAVKVSITGEKCRDLTGESCPPSLSTEGMTVLPGQVQGQTLGKSWGKAVLSVNNAHKSF